MLIDKESFPAGAKEGVVQTHTLRFTREDLRASFFQVRDCPIYRAMRRAGVPVDHVGRRCFTLADGREIEFPHDLEEVSWFLCQTEDSLFRGFRRRWLVNSEYTVSIPC